MSVNAKCASLPLCACLCSSSPLSVQFHRKVRPVDPVTGVPRARAPSEEATLAKALGSKVRLDPKDLDAVRNGNLTASPAHGAGEGKGVAGALLIATNCSLCRLRREQAG